MVVSDSQKSAYNNYYKKIKDSRLEYYRNYYNSNKDKMAKQMKDRNNSIDALMKYYWNHEPKKNCFAFFPMVECFSY